MKTKIKSLTELTAFEEYIKGQQPLVARVYTGSIYFYGVDGGYCQHSIFWDIAGNTNIQLQKSLLAAVNAACNTDFELENDVVK
jgi:hypothetical protein